MKKELNFTPGGAQPQAQPAMNIDLTSLPNLRCPHCNNQVFQQLFIAKRVSALQSPQGKEGVAPMQIFACTECGAVPVEFGGSLVEQDDKKEKESKKDGK